MSTLDYSAPKLSPALDQMRLWYAACGYLGDQMGKEQAIVLKSDDTGDKDMGKVLRPAPISATDVGNTLKSFKKAKKMTKELKLPPVLETMAPSLKRRWPQVMSSGATAIKDVDNDRPMDEQIEDCKAISNKVGVSRAVSGLQLLLGDKLDRQFLPLCQKAASGEALAKVVQKLWAKKTPMEQSEIEVELLDWLTLIRETWGNENVQQSKDKVFKRIETAMQKYIHLCNQSGWQG